MNKKIAVILFNIGGPNKISEVKPYLRNFFSDKFIIGLPWIFRKFLAILISTTRSSKTSEIYNKIGGRSPILANTNLQAEALEKKLGEDFKIYVVMRYWHPFAEEITKIVNNIDYDQVILLPLYPQCSSTTTVSAYYNWINIANKLDKTKLICSHYKNEKFIQSYYNLILNECKKAEKIGEFKILFSAHSIPEYLVTKKGDPYQEQIIDTVKRIIEKLSNDFPEIKYIITYQSKVGKLKWLEPKTDQVLMETKEIPVIVPIAFVSENSETLYELDMEYKELLGERNLFRVPTVSCDKLYIECLSDLVIQAVNSKEQFVTKREKCGKTYCPCVNYENISRDR